MAGPLWNSETPPPSPKISLLGWLFVVVRGLVLGTVTFGGLAILLLVRLVEQPIYGLHRPWTPFVTQFVCRAAFFILGIRYMVEGQLMPHRGAVVSNHVSWLDIFSLNAAKRVYFVSKSEVAGWPMIGWLARATGTVFIDRDRKQAKKQKAMFESRLEAGHRLLFFPEGTSTDGLQVLQFKSTLFAAFFTPELQDHMWIQPATLFYLAPKGQDARFYGWWGEMEFGGHFLHTLAAIRQGEVRLIYHDAVKVDDFTDRKSLAAHCEAEVRKGLEQCRQSGFSPV